jgi:hypothetical protein
MSRVQLIDNKTIIGIVPTMKIGDGNEREKDNKKGTTESLLRRTKWALGPKSDPDL